MNQNADSVKAVFFSLENDRPASLVPDLIDYNMPLTTTYLKQMKLQCINNNEQVLTENHFACCSCALTDIYIIALAFYFCQFIWDISEVWLKANELWKIL